MAMTWGDVVFYLPFDGEPITDVMGNAITQSGTITSETGWHAPLTGNTTSALFDGYNTPLPGLVFASNAALNAIGTADYYFGTWYRSSDITSSQTLVTIGTSALDIFIKNEGVSVSSSIGYVIDGAYTMTADTDHFIEISRVAGVTRYFLDGVLQDSSTATYAVTQASALTRVGSYKTGSIVSEGLKGYVDDMIFAHAGGHTANYTRPASKMSVMLDAASGGATGVAAVPITIATYAGGSAALPVALTVAGFGNAVAGLEINSIQAALLSGASSLSDGGAIAAAWSPVVTIDGTEVTAEIVGQIDVDATEGAARVARFSMTATGEINLPALVGRQITIDLADAAGNNRFRLFTGIINQPSIDLDNKTIAIDCTDDLQNAVDATLRESLADLIGGRWSSVIFDKGASSWVYANDRLSTVSASLDRSPLGALRVTPWASKAVADLSFDEDDILSESLAVSFADRSSLVNQVDVAFGYRFQRAKREAFRFQFAYLTSGLGDWVGAGNGFLQKAVVIEAVEAAGGKVDTVFWDELPTVPIAVGGSFWQLDPAVAALLCLGFDLVAIFDYSQNTQEDYTITVASQASINAVGQIRTAMSGALEAETPDPVAAETNAMLYQLDISKIPPTDLAVTLAGYTTAKAVTATADTDRAAADNAIETLIDVAKTKIAESHRRGTISASVPLNPWLDLDKTVSILAQGVTAKGKVSRVKHRMSADLGEAVSEFELAICRLDGLGLAQPETTTAAPAGVADGPTSELGPVVCTFNGLLGQDNAFTIVFPGVDSSERDNAVVPISAQVEVPIVEDLQTIVL